MNSKQEKTLNTNKHFFVLRVPLSWYFVYFLLPCLRCTECSNLLPYSARSLRRRGICHHRHQYLFLNYTALNIKSIKVLVYTWIARYVIFVLLAGVRSLPLMQWKLRSLISTRLQCSFLVCRISTVKSALEGVWKPERRTKLRQCKLSVLIC